MNNKLIEELYKKIENQDKIINDLQFEKQQLSDYAYSCDLLIDDLRSNFFPKKDYVELQQENKQLKEELEKEKQKNSKAIDMLESQYISGVYYANYETTEDNLYQPVTIKDRLAIEILKGEDNGNNR